MVYCRQQALTKVWWG